MRCSDNPKTRELANQLIDLEEVEVTPVKASIQIVIRVCDKVRRPLATLAGVAGYRSLLSRALNLAKQECPNLGAWQVKPDGSLQVVDGGAIQSGAVLVAHLLGLMITLIGESLTLQLLHEVWLELPICQAEVERKDPK